MLAAGASLALAALEPAIDRMIRFDFFHARSERGRRAMSKKELQRLAEELAPYRFDLAIDLRRQPDTRRILQHTGARWLAGFDQQNKTTWLDIAVEWEGDIARTHKRDAHLRCAACSSSMRWRCQCESDRRVIGTLVARRGRRAMRWRPCRRSRHSARSCSRAGWCACTPAPGRRTSAGRPRRSPG